MEPEGSLQHSQAFTTRPYPEPDQSSQCPHSTIWRPIFILFSHLHLGLPSGLLSSDRPTKSCMHLSSRYTCHIPLPSHSSRVDHPNNNRWAVQIIKLPIIQSSPLPRYLVPLSPSILLNLLFSNILSLRSSFNVSDQVSHPYKTTGNIIVLYILIFKFLDSKLEDKRFCTEWSQIQTASNGI
jgi:hypothetical protein